MARAVRLHPRVAGGNVMARPRLEGRLAARWERRLIAVSAGPGFGKSVLLASALADGTAGADREDRWLSCEVADADAAHLAAGVALACGLERAVDPDEIAHWIWGRAPGHVCLLLDDVHRIGDDSAGARWLAQLVDALPRNGHVVTASRTALPFSLQRLAMDGELERMTEADLLFDSRELDALALATGSAPETLEASGGWPALAALQAKAGGDLIEGFLWDEILERLGSDRVRALAQLQSVGGGDDRLVSELTGGRFSAEALTEGVPLTERREGGWVRLHDLWRPPLERLLSPSEIEDARRIAIGAHRETGRFCTAADLAIAGEDWECLLAVLRDVGVRPAATYVPSQLRRWYRALPPDRRLEPAAWFAAGMEQAARNPRRALVAFREALAGFRSRQDIEAELTTIGHLALHAVWENDFAALVDLHDRTEELAAAGSKRAATMCSVGEAVVANLQGDSRGVLDALRRVDHDELGALAGIAQWLRSVAHRRAGDLDGAIAALDVLRDLPPDRLGPQIEIGRLRARWLGGVVDEVVGGFEAAHRHFSTTGDRFLGSEIALDLAAKLAFLGRTAEAAELHAWAQPVSELPGAVIRCLDLITRTALAVAEGDEAAATRLLRDAREPALDGPGGWYWTDRAAVALCYVLRPEIRSAIDALELPSVHRVGVDLARAVVATRSGDLGAVAAFRWPSPGTVRVHLPARWLVELASAGDAAGNPAPLDLLEIIDGHEGDLVRTAASPGMPAPIRAAARRRASVIAPDPGFSLEIDVLGPLRVARDGVPIAADGLRRRRVRELLCCLAANPRQRRTALAEELWPDVADPSANLRVNLTHLQRTLEPHRPRGAPPFFVRTDGEWLVLVGGDRLVVDVWTFDGEVDRAAVAERSGDVAAALAHHLAVLPLWRGEPYADVEEAPWLASAREDVRRRFTAAAVRAGELLLARGDWENARLAGSAALRASPFAEVAHRLLIRSYRDEGDLPAAVRTLWACEAALADLGLPLDPATRALVEPPSGFAAPTPAV